MLVHIGWGTQIGSFWSQVGCDVGKSRETATSRRSRPGMSIISISVIASPRYVKPSAPMTRPSKTMASPGVPSTSAGRTKRAWREYLSA